MAATQHPRARASPGVRSEISGAAAIALRDAGFDAKYMKGGHSAWKAIGESLGFELGMNYAPHRWRQA
jgi:hypothetical protein